MVPWRQTSWVGQFCFGTLSPPRHPKIAEAWVKQAHRHVTKLSTEEVYLLRFGDDAENQAIDQSLEAQWNTCLVFVRELLTRGIDRDQVSQFSKNNQAEVTCLLGVTDSRRANSKVNQIIQIVSIIPKTGWGSQMTSSSSTERYTITMLISLI